MAALAPSQRAQQGFWGEPGAAVVMMSAVVCPAGEERSAWSRTTCQRIGIQREDSVSLSDGAVWPVFSQVEALE